MYYLNHFDTYEKLVTAVAQFIHYYNHQQAKPYAAGWPIGSCLKENQDLIPEILEK